MSVYGEFLFLENAISGTVILILTCRFCGLHISRNGHEGDVPAWKIAAGSIMCGIYGFTVIIKMHWLAAIVSKLSFSALVVCTVMRPVSVKMFFKNAAVFYIVTFLMGGLTIALMYMTGTPGVTANGSSYFYGTEYIKIAAGITFSLAAGLWMADHLKEKQRKERVMSQVVIHIGMHSWTFNGFSDTGNFMREPVSGNPAVLISGTAGRKILVEAGEERESRFCLIPYRSVGRKGVLYGLRPDYITVGERVIEDVVLAFFQEDFMPWRGIYEYEVLLHEQMLEGEE